MDLLNDPMMRLALIGALAVCAIGGALFALLGASEDSAARRRRQGVAGGAAAAASTGGKAGGGWSLGDLFNTKEPSAADRLRELQEEAKKLKRAGLRLKLEQAGLTLSPAAYLMRFQVAALAILIGFVIFELPLIAALGAAAFVALLGPNLMLKKMIDKRVQSFLQHFPPAIDVLVRGVRAGMPVSESLKVIGEEIQDPVGTEMRRVVANTNMGMSLEDALEQMSMRVPSTDVNFFRTVLSIQKQTGGNLAEALSNLSEVLRERQKLKKKVRALSSEARMSAIIIGSLPFGVTAMIYMLQPDYLIPFFGDFRGQVMIGIGLVWMSFGVLMMRAMVKFEV